MAAAEEREREAEEERRQQQRGAALEAVLRRHLEKSSRRSIAVYLSGWLRVRFIDLLAAAAAAAPPLLPRGTVPLSRYLGPPPGRLYAPICVLRRS